MNQTYESGILSDFDTSEPPSDVGEEECPFLVDLYVQKRDSTYSI
jgi:hypothetical protein